MVARDQSLVTLTTKDIDIVASRLAARYLLSEGYEVADLNHLVPGYGIYNVFPGIVERFLKKGPAKYLWDELEKDDPRILFFHKTFAVSQERLRLSYKTIPKKLAKLIMTLLPRNHNSPIDYIVRKSDHYSFIELKANKSKLSKKQIEVCELILSSGYDVSVLHMELSIAKKVTIETLPISL